MCLDNHSRKRPAPLLYGYRFREDYYVSGGAGYVLTRQALQLFGSHLHDNILYAQCNASMEDMMVGTCLQKVLEQQAVFHYPIVGESIDEDGRERFHPLTFRVHFNGPGNKSKREWIHYRPFHHNLFVSFAVFFWIQPIFPLFLVSRATKQSVRRPLVFIIHRPK